MVKDLKEETATIIKEGAEWRERNDEMEEEMRKSTKQNSVMKIKKTTNRQKSKSNQLMRESVNGKQI